MRSISEINLGGIKTRVPPGCGSNFTKEFGSSLSTKMAVLGIGVDLVEVDSFGKQLSQPGSRFPNIFTHRERRECKHAAKNRDQRSHSEKTVQEKPVTSFVGNERTVNSETVNKEYESLAVRWAAREAFIKAWSGALLGKAPPLADTPEVWRGIEVRQDRWKRPYLYFSETLREALAASLGETDTHLSLTHDGGWAQAFVVISKAQP